MSRDHFLPLNGGAINIYGHPMLSFYRTQGSSILNDALISLSEPRADVFGRSEWKRGTMELILPRNWKLQRLFILVDIVFHLILLFFFEVMACWTSDRSRP